MANSYSTLPVTGQGVPKATQPRSTAMQAAIVPAADLAKADSVLNDITKSGKQEGGVFIQDTSGALNIAISMAPLETSAWCLLTPGTEITPA